MTDFPGSPRILKGAIIAIPFPIPVPNVIVFQYNPESLTRTVTARAAKSEGAKSEALRLEGAARETIKLKVEIDATDQLERGDALTAALGIHPQLASLELLLHPPTATVLANLLLSLFGTIEIIPMNAPLTLFVWGAKRVVPVRMTSMSITETAYDTGLNPIQASADFTMEVLSYSDLDPTNPGFYIHIAHQVVKEVMSAEDNPGGIGRIASGGAKLF